MQRPDGRARVGDPLRRPWQAPATLAAPVGSLADKVRVLRWLASVRSGPPAALLGRPDGTTAARLDEVGFSPAMAAPTRSSSSSLMRLRSSSARLASVTSRLAPT